MKTSSDHFIMMRDRISVFDQMQIETMTIILSAPSTKALLRQNTVVVVVVGQTQNCCLVQIAAAD